MCLINSYLVFFSFFFSFLNDNVFAIRCISLVATIISVTKNISECTHFGEETAGVFLLKNKSKEELKILIKLTGRRASYNLVISCPSLAIYGCAILKIII